MNVKLCSAQSTSHEVPLNLSKMQAVFFLENLNAQCKKYHLYRVGQPVRDQKPHNLLWVTAKSNIMHMATHKYHLVPSSLKHTYLCSARFIANIKHQHDNDKILQAAYCYACYLVGHLVIAKRSMRLWVAHSCCSFAVYQNAVKKLRKYHRTH